MSLLTWVIAQNADHLAIACAMSALWSAYLLGLLIPGPNLVAIGGLVSLRGFSASVPMALGVATGSFLQAVSLVLGMSLLWQGDGLDLIGRSIGALLLVGLGVHLWHGSTAALALDTATDSRGTMHFFAGVSTGISNPISFAGMTAQLLGPASILLGTTWGLLAAAGIALLSLIRSLLVAKAFSLDGAQRAAAALRRPVSVLVASVFVLMRINIAGPVAPAVFGLARATSGAAKPDMACHTAGASVVVTSAGAAERVCGIVSMANALLSRCGLEIEHGARIHILDGALQASGRLTHGQYLPGSRRIDVVGETQARRLQLAQSDHGQLSFEAFYAGIITHELVHLSFHSRTAHLPLPIGAHEYVAYAFQVLSFPGGERVAFLAQFPSRSTTGLSTQGLQVFGPMLAVVNPAHFAALAFRHFADPLNGCRFINRLRGGLEAFPPETAE